MKILYITNGITGSGGLERVLSIKASYLAEHLGYEVEIASLNENDKEPFYHFSTQIKRHNINVGGNPLQYIKAYVKGIKNVVKISRPDIISVCDDGLKGFFLPTLLKNTCPIIYERHVSKLAEVNETNGKGIKKIMTDVQFSLMNILGSTFDKFILLSEENKKEWPLKNIEVISNPLSFYASESSSLENSIVIAVGKQSYQKGYDRLLESWLIVQQQHPQWQLHIYGKFDPSQQLLEKAQHLGISDSVSFFEPVKNIEDKYMEASIYLMSSRYEGFGMVLIEAMACGLPCISFNCPCGPSDIISNDSDGFLVENGNIKSLADKISLLIEDTDLRKKMGFNAKQNVKRFLPENIVNQWDSLFKALQR